MNVTKLTPSIDNHGGALVIINGRKCTMNSVRSYTLYNNAIYGETECPDSAVAKSEKLGHELYWINLSSSVICGDTGYYEREAAKWADAPSLIVGDIVEFEGKLFEIHRAPNNNFKPISA